MVLQALSLSLKGIVLPMPMEDASGFISVEIGGFIAEAFKFRTGGSEESGVLCMLKDKILQGPSIVPMEDMMRRSPINVSIMVQDTRSGEMRIAGHGRMLEQDIPTARTRDVDALTLGLGGLKGVHVTPIGQLDIDLELESQHTLHKGAMKLGRTTFNTPHRPVHSSYSLT